MQIHTGKLSRRGFGRLLAASPAALAAAAKPLPGQAPAAPLSREEELRAANQRRIAAAQTLSKFDLPMAAEPAFVFHP
jgi:hypothetical protein